MEPKVYAIVYINLFLKVLTSRPLSLLSVHFFISLYDYMWLVQYNIYGSVLMEGVGSSAL